MRKITSSRGTDGWLFGLADRLHVRALLGGLPLSGTYKEDAFVAQMTARMGEESPFITLKQKEWLDIILRRHGKGNLTDICATCGATAWGGSTDSLYRYLAGLKPLLNGEFGFHYGYAGCLEGGVLAVREFQTSDSFIFVNFTDAGDANLVDGEVRHYLNNDMIIAALV